MKKSLSLSNLSLLFASRKIRLLTFALSFFFFALFIDLTWELWEHDQKLYVLDQTIIKFFARHRLAVLNGSALDITALGSPTLSLMISIITLGLLLLNKMKRELIYFISASFGAGIWSVIIKNIIERPRPQDIPALISVEGFSYPSGHTLVATAIYLSLAFILNKNFKFKYSSTLYFSVSIILFSLVGFSRTYLGVHYPSDALSGVFFGSAWAIFLAAFL